MTNITPKLGVPMSPADAEAYIDAVNRKVVQRWRERVTEGPFMEKFLDGSLPMPAIRLFFKNWGNFTVEINTLVSVSYHKHIGFFKRHPDLMGPLGPRSPMNSFIPSRQAMFWSCCKRPKLWGSQKIKSCANRCCPSAALF
ncbi:MAG TPA: hypothetical protein VIM04_04050 [Candidatus Binatia bacterium]